MLQTIDFNSALSPSILHTDFCALKIKLGELQRKYKDLGIPVIIVFEGWKASGKGTLINKLMLNLDPRGFTVYPILPASEEEQYRPYLWRFWTKTPPKGRIALFDHSWYAEVVEQRVTGNKKGDEQYREILSFERQLADSGVVMMKFFLHVTKKEQKKRFRKLENHDETAWKITKEDWKNHRHYQTFYEAYDEALEKTDAQWAPWMVVAADDENIATVSVFQTIIQRLQAKLDDHSVPAVPRLPKLSAAPLGKIDLSLAVSDLEHDEAVKKYKKRLRELEFELYKRRIPAVIVFEGWDAAGKGGNIKRLAGKLDPRGYEVVPVAAPNDLEKAHHYLWRFWNKFPKAGHISIFDRSWYGRVLVERVEGFCNETDWKRAYQEINEMEEQWVDFGAVLIKFWLQISPEEQLKRFEERQNDPAKQWKITDEDWRNRDKWDQYLAAVNEMLYRTSSTKAPWTIVEAESKWYGRVKTLKTVIQEIERRL